MLGHQLKKNPINTFPLFRVVGDIIRESLCSFSMEIGEIFKMFSCPIRIRISYFSDDY